MAQWPEQPCSLHEIPGLNPRIMHVLQKVTYTYIRVYTDLYPDIHCLYAYTRPCISIHVFIRVFTEIYRVILVCMLIYSVHTSIYWFVLSTVVAFCQPGVGKCDFRVTAGGSPWLQEDDGYSNNKRSNGSNTHRLKSAILKFRMSRSEVCSRFAEPEGLEDGLKTALKTAWRWLEDGLKTGCDNRRDHYFIVEGKQKFAYRN